MTTSLLSRKRKRRRGPEKPALSAQLILDNGLEGDAGHLCVELFQELFPGTADEDIVKDEVYHVAIAAQQSLLGNDTKHDQWTILPVRPSLAKTDDMAHARTVRLPASSASTQALVNKLKQESTRLGRAIPNTAIEVKILDVEPLPLTTVVVNVQDAGCTSHNDQSESLSGHMEDLQLSVAENLLALRLIYVGQCLSLVKTLEGKGTTEITANVRLCEPVRQGYITATTKVVIYQDVHKSRSKHELIAAARRALPVPVEEDDGEDTSNERFYSAAEGPQQSPARTVKKSRLPSVNVQPSETEDSSDVDDDDTDFSDDDTDAVGLSLPGLPVPPSGTLSAQSSTTIGNGKFANGSNTPGSMISSFSNSTIRPGDGRGRIFETRQMRTRVPEHFLYPRPGSDEDDEARIYTDSSSLAKLGCFSGDWISVEVVKDDLVTAINDSTLGSRDLCTRRIAKIYALQSLVPQKPRYSLDRGVRRTSSSSFTSAVKLLPSVYVSPLMLSSLAYAAKVKLSVVSSTLPNPASRTGGQRPGKLSPARPPIAKEVCLVKIATPLATERELQDVILQQLRVWFQQRRRIVKEGDLIPLMLDKNLGKATFRGTTTDTAETDLDMNVDLLQQLTQNRDNQRVIWFKIGLIATENSKALDNPDDVPDAWAGMAVVDVKANLTRITQSGSEQARLPKSMISPWQYYLGIRPSPHSLNDGNTIDFGDALLTDEYISHLRRRLRELISAALSPQAIHFKLPAVAILMRSAQRHIGKATTVHHACEDLGVHVFEIDGYDILSEDSSGGGDTKTVATLEARADRAMTCGAQCTAILLRHIDVLTSERMAATLQGILTIARVLIATTSAIDKVPEGIRGIFTHEIEVNAPDEKEREGLLSSIIGTSANTVAPTVSLTPIAIKTAALVAGDLADVVARASVARAERLEGLVYSTNASRSTTQDTVNLRDIQLAGGDAARYLTKADFDVAVDAARKNFADAIGAPQIPNVSWDDVGGLAHVKDAVMETIQLPLERPELFAKGMKKRSGILFYGPPGTGKTLLAKAIATEFSLNFFSVKGPELLNMYVGESEANVRRVFQRARDARPCVVFFDELDSVAPKRGNQGDSGGVMDRIVSQLLAELDGMSNGDDGSGSGGGGGVFVIGATNRPDLLDQALLRPGRFDKMLYLGVSDTHDKQLTILEALTRKFKLHPSLSLRKVAESLPYTYTGADLYALCSDAMLKAITRRASSVDVKVRAINAERATASPPKPPVTVAWFFDHIAQEEDTEVVVEEEDFHAASRELVPSVSVKELQHYERVKKSFEQGDDGGKEQKQAAPQHRISQQMMPLMPKAERNDTINGHSTNDEADTSNIISGTEALNLNGPTRKSKGKGKAIYHDNVESLTSFGDAADANEDLYS